MTSSSVVYIDNKPQRRTHMGKDPAEDAGIERGDIVRVGGREGTVTGFTRDGRGAYVRFKEGTPKAAKFARAEVEPLVGPGPTCEICGEEIIDQRDGAEMYDAAMLDDEDFASEARAGVVHVDCGTAAGWRPK
jgi:hypothetical protein